MNNYSDEDLLVIVSFQKENESEAKEAFTIFYNRHKQYLCDLCLSVCRETELAKDVMQNTWIAVYKYSHTYNAKKSSVRTWMSKIAKNKTLDIITEQKELMKLYEDIYSIESVGNEENSNILSLEKKELDKALNTLSVKEKDILLTYMQFSFENKHLPDNITNELLVRYGTTPENLRQIKRRSLEKMKNYLKSNKLVATN